ncbi:MAG: glycosyltransferase family 2 protein [Bacteroidota bacterium]|nr:glycosyltransferase family 2 protein [Bacteroidota bacterium]MDQ6889299.1 glycosyltransferase family 2 protein [Bacteroidota bacterium]
MDDVIAVVVTYNRQELLAQCITALRNQTRKVDKILVINNGSTDATEDWLHLQPDVDFITQKNVGGAGGFSKGIKTAFEMRYSWIWLMDDDGYPKQDALEILLEGDHEELCLRNCAVINKEDRKSFVWKTSDYAYIDEVREDKIKSVAHPFNGTLLHRKIIERVGFPKANLFLWGDETEYLYRIVKKNKIPFYTKTKSIHYHPACVYSYKNDWSITSNWKMYYYVRNRFFILKTKFSKSSILAFMMYIVFLIAFATTIIIFQKTNKVKKLSFLLWPMTDAFTNNCDATPPLILKRLSSSQNGVGGFLMERVKILKGSLSSPASSSL